MNQKSNTTPIIILGILFFVFGFFTWLNGTLIPLLQLVCELKTTTQAFLVTFAFYMAYFFLALPSSAILRLTGFRNGLSLGLLSLAAGSLLFIPAAGMRSYGLFLTGLFIQGSGLALLQTAANPYISLIGPIDSAAKRISIMGICNKTAGALAPIMLGAVALRNASELEAQLASAGSDAARAGLLTELASRLVYPYIAMALMLVIIAAVIRKSVLPEINPSKDLATHLADGHRNVFQFPHLLLGVACIFLYMGVEVMAGDAIGMYGRALGFSLDETKYYTAFTMAAMLTGYVASVITIPRYVSQKKALSVSALLGVVFSLCFFASTGKVAILFIALLGLANAVMWPAIFPLAINGLGRFTGTGSALLIMGIAGGALIPLFYGTLTDSFHVPINAAFLICVLPSYIYILYYSIKGHMAGRKTGSLVPVQAPGTVIE